nr:exodeoxyribonuclease V subunit gamma [Ruminococcus sp.]
MVQFIIGHMGSGKTTRMFQEIKKCSGRQLVIVPEQFSYEFDKKLYYYVGAEKFNEILSLTFTGLSRQIFQLFGDLDRKGEYADDYARMILIYQAIASVQKIPDTLKYFGKQSSYNGFAEEVLDIINDLKRSGIEPDTLIEKSALLDGRLTDKTRDIAEIYMEYNRFMTEYGFKDNLENIIQSAEIANREEFFRDMNIYIDEFESFNGDQLEMIRIMIESAENVYIALRTDNVNAGNFTLFDTVNNTYRRIKQICNEINIKPEIIDCRESKRFKNKELRYLSEHIMRNFTYNPAEAPEPDNIRIFEAKDMYSEVEYVCATIKHLIHENPELHYSDIAVLSNNIESYADILRETFERCEIPYFLSIARPVIHSSIMVFFTSVMEILTAHKIKSEHIFRILKCGILD